MAQATRTPNPATSTRPERSSKRVAHKKPLAWLPLALLGLLALLALLAFLVIRGANHSTSSAASSAPAVAPAAPTPAPAPGAAGQGAAGGTPVSSAGALVGGAGIAPAPAGSAGSGSGTTVAAPAPGTTGTVLFGQGGASVDAAGQQVVAAAARNLRAAGARSVQVIGYTDVVAGSPVNGPLSQQRADAVAAALKPQLPAGVPVTATAKGEADPAASNDTDSGRQQNRRVAIIGTT